MTTTEHADQPADAPASTAKAGLIYPGMGLLFAVLICCFTAWGVAADLTTPMVAGFKRIFEMNTFQASLVQLAYFGAYFLLAIPAALINQRFGYKAGLLSGVLLAAAGAIAFYPASKIMTYEAFLVALFAIAAGCSILETSANPYVLSLGPEETATRRLNFAQAFNPVGTNIGVLLAATLILPKLDEPVNMANLSPAEEQAIRAGQLGAVMGPYLGLGFVLILLRRDRRALHDLIASTAVVYAWDARAARLAQPGRCPFGLHAGAPRGASARRLRAGSAGAATRARGLARLPLKSRRR